MNRESFSSSCLPIRKDCAVVALHATVSDGLGDVVEDCSLVHALMTHEVEIIFFLVNPLLHDDLSLVDLQAFLPSVNLLSLVQRSDSDANLDIVLLVRRVEYVVAFREMVKHQRLLRFFFGICRALFCGLGVETLIKIEFLA